MICAGKPSAGYCTRQTVPGKPEDQIGGECWRITIEGPVLEGGKLHYTGADVPKCIAMLNHKMVAHILTVINAPHFV